MNAIAKFFTTPSFARTVVIVGIVVIIFILIYRWRGNSKRRQQDKQFEQDYNKLTTESNQQPTYLQTNYQEYADRIYAAGCEGLFCYGTNEEAIYEVFRKMQNALDVLLLVKAFGLREERGGVCIPIPGTGECDVPLSSWLQTELSADEFKEVNNILAQKGINYQF